MNGPAIICQRMKSIREKKGLTSKEAAKALGMKVSTYSHYETGMRYPKLDTFYEICIFYDVDPNYFFGLSDTPHPFSKQLSEKEKEKAWKDAQEALEDATQKLYKLSPR